jgi:hypothetical protein
VRKVLIALVVLAFCGVAIASSGPLFNHAWRAAAQFTPQTKGGHGGGPGSPSSGFTSASTGINSNGFVYVTFRDSLGKANAGQAMNYSFTAAGAANWVCATKGGGKGKHQAVGGWTTMSYPSYTNNFSYTVPNNGTVSGGSALPPPAEPSTFCSGTWELGAVSYLLPSGSLTNVTNGDTADNVMSGTCTIGSPCSDVFVAGVPAPQIQ